MEKVISLVAVLALFFITAGAIQADKPPVPEGGPYNCIKYDCDSNNDGIPELPPIPVTADEPEVPSDKLPVPPGIPRDCVKYDCDSNGDGIPELLLPENWRDTD